MSAHVPIPRRAKPRPRCSGSVNTPPIGTMQKPLDPAESMKHLVTFPEFDVSLFTAEPDIIKPRWSGWDERGRLWISETIDYPNELQLEGEGRDRLKICEDTDGDGRADKFTIFADKLSIPTSFVFANGGVIVIHSGKTEFFKDTNGDDKADESKVLFSGWGMGDTHVTASNLRYGFDGWIWGTVGYSGFRGTVGGNIANGSPAGDTLVPMLVTLLSIWGVQQPLAYFLPHHFGLGQLGIAWAITLAVMVRPLCYVPYFFWGPWMRKHPLGRQREGIPAATAT